MFHLVVVFFVRFVSSRILEMEKHRVDDRAENSGHRDATILQDFEGQ